MRKYIDIIEGRYLSETLANSRTFYHITLRENLPYIFEKGLVPSRGERSRKLKEPEAVFLFPDRESAEQAVMGWLGDQFDEEVELSLIEVVIPMDIEVKRTEGIDWECYTTRPIPPQCLKLIAVSL